MNLTEVFARTKQQNRAAMIAYLPVGYPDHKTSLAAFAALATAGVDIIEVGIPYSDPLMDGPVIQAATTQALNQGTQVSDTFDAVQTITDHGSTPVVMSYWNLIDKYGVERFAAKLAAAGGQGIITPDLIPDEAAAWTAASDTHHLDRIYVVAPSSTEQRLRYTTAAGSGFVYAASTMGVTGTRQRVSADASHLVGRIRQTTDLPVCVGLGVSNADQARAVATYADGVIVGSALVKALGEQGIDAMTQLAKDLIAGVQR